MATKIYVNLPVRDLERSVRFYTELGYNLNQQFSDEQAACVVIGDNIFVMLLVESFFKTFTSKEVCDATKSTEVLVCISASSRQEVDDLISRALAAGGTSPMPAKDAGYMYSGGFQDMDGHMWEVVYMEPTSAEQV
eukprot:jgi/Chrzof1/10834/Cz05g13250.t1